MIPGLAAILHAAAQPSGKTYEQFVTHITALGAGSVAGGSAAIVGKFRFVPTNPPTGPNILAGTPWAGSGGSGAGIALSGFSTLDGISVHASPDRDAYNLQAALGQQVYLELTALAGASNVPAITRNSLTSASLFSTVRATCPRFLIFDPVLGPLEMQPNLGLGPAPYDWII